MLFGGTFATGGPCGPPLGAGFGAWDETVVTPASFVRGPRWAFGGIALGRTMVAIWALAPSVNSIRHASKLTFFMELSSLLKVME